MLLTFITHDYLKAKEMKLTIKKRIDGGGFGDIWLAVDDLERELAVKIIRPASVGISDALAHAKALARAKHTNVVAVIGLETISDPEGTDNVDCVVMELLKGTTLSKILKGPKLSRQRLQSIGSGIIQGIMHIHAEGLVHGDLHEENVMVDGDEAKVIDILYLDSLSACSTQKRESRLKRDITSLRLILQQLIVSSEIDSAEATEFNNMLDTESGIKDIELAFAKILLPGAVDDGGRALDHAYIRLVEEDFVQGKEYALALLDETPEHLAAPILLRLCEQRDYRHEHRFYITALWTRLSAEEKKVFAQNLGVVLDTDIPKGSFGPSLRLLSLLQRDVWAGLTPRIRIKIETAITRDVLAGKKDIRSLKKTDGGALGTYARSLWTRFANTAQLAENIISLLYQSWYTQNYVGEYFLTLIPEIANRVDKRDEFIKAIRSAISNDAKIVVQGIADLPDDWIEEITEE